MSGSHWYDYPMLCLREPGCLPSCVTKCCVCVPVAVLFLSCSRFRVCVFVCLLRMYFLYSLTEVAIQHALPANLFAFSFIINHSFKAQKACKPAIGHTAPPRSKRTNWETGQQHQGAFLALADCATRGETHLQSSPFCSFS